MTITVDGREFRKVFVAIPSHSDAVKVMTMKALLQSALQGVADGFFFSIESYAGVVPISHCRNVALAAFLSSDCDDLFLVDDDLAWSAGSMVRLLKHPVDFVVGAYPYRGDPLPGGSRFPVNFGTERPAIVALDPLTGKPSESGLIPIDGAGAGFMRLTRRCVERMVAYYAADWYAYEHAKDGKLHCLFDFVIRDHVWSSEDMNFCRKWREMGETVWLDPDIDFVHIGNKGFTGNISRWLRERPAFAGERAAYLASRQPTNSAA